MRIQETLGKLSKSRAAGKWGGFQRKAINLGGKSNLETLRLWGNHTTHSEKSHRRTCPFPRNRVGNQRPRTAGSLLFQTFAPLARRRSRCRTAISPLLLESIEQTGGVAVIGFQFETLLAVFNSQLDITAVSVQLGETEIGERRVRKLLDGEV